MPLVNGATEQIVRQLLAGLVHPVTLAVFSKSGRDVDARQSCAYTRNLAEEIAALSGGRVVAEMYDIDSDAGIARIYGIDKAPAVVVLGDDTGRRDFGIRFFGAPLGYEFSTLIEDIRMASAGTTDLATDTLEALRRLKSPLRIQVFVTPTCPYCPRAVFLAHKLAVASDLVTADAVDATEFPDLARHYHVQGVPRTVVNDTVQIEGAVPEPMLMRELARLFEAAAAT